jgi:hypothetical protein
VRGRRECDECKREMTFQRVGDADDTAFGDLRMGGDCLLD